MRWRWSSPHLSLPWPRDDWGSAVAGLHLEFQPRDLWLGCYWESEWEGPHRFLTLYLCLLPMVPLVVSVKTGTVLRPRPAGRGRVVLAFLRWLGWAVAVVAVQVVRNREVRWRVYGRYAAAERALGQRLAPDPPPPGPCPYCAGSGMTKVAADWGSRGQAVYREPCRICGGTGRG